MARELFPEIHPYEHGTLEVGGGHHLYWECCGNPAGIPALVLHGGPGSGCTPLMRRYFDPSRYRVVLLDQRGCGRSAPRVDEHTELSTNTTHHLLGDLERLREHLGVQRWLVWGASWGVTLGLLYAQLHPERVRAMVLVSVTMTRPEDIRWLYHGLGRFLPEEWERFRRGAPAADRSGDLVAAYHRLLHEQPDRELRREAAASWCRWEDASLSLEPGWRSNPRYADPRFRMTFARVVTHYFRHHAWLRDGQILEDADRLTGIPATLIHGRLDLGSPAEVPWRLARRWPDARLHLVGGGHAGGGEMTDRILEATDGFSSSE